MHTAIIASKKDPAAINIKECLESYQLQDMNAHVHEIEKEAIFAEDLDKTIEADQFIVASKHVSKENTPALTCHAIGNWSINEFGGRAKALCGVSASLLRNIFLELNKVSREKIPVTLEATHHGPYVEKPVIFVEIGSSEEQWTSIELGMMVAEAIYQVLSRDNGISSNSANSSNSPNVAFAIGGPHYCNSFNKIVLGTDIAIGHICPNYHLEHLNKDLIQEAMNKTKEKVDFALLDWKGLGTEKQRILDLLQEMHIEIKRTDQL